MTTFIILILLIAIGGYLCTKDDYNLLGFIVCSVCGICIIMHSIFYFTVSYEYNVFVEKRNAFEQTLNESRKNGNQFEAAAIVKDISEWNQQLAKHKYSNKTIFLDQYIDDRIESLEPIK